MRTPGTSFTRTCPGAPEARPDVTRTSARTVLTAAMAGSALTLAGVIVLAPLLSRPFVLLFG
ncbi:hypothetical protein, partial [Streptomyces sp. NPDC002537]